MSDQHDIGRVPDAVLPRKHGAALPRVIGSLMGWAVLFGAVFASIAFWFWNEFTAPGPLVAAKTVVLPDGASRTDISRLLETEGVISDERVLNGVSLLAGLRGVSLKSGEYAFQPGATMGQVFDAISSGRVITYKLTVPEGWTSQMALARINGNEVLGGPAVPPQEVAEGAIVADTMVFRRGMTRAKLVQDMKAMQAELVEEVWARRSPDSPVKSKEELVTLASIVEKETGIPEERPRVAAVFLNRLKQGMRLQSDPTIIYGLVGGQGKLDRALTRADIDSDTPYNTYKIPGLPPGPIATPGRAALEAVIAPAPSEDLYFVADGTGGHAFAKTLEEHNANVARWRDQQKQGNLLPESADAAAADAAAADEAAAPEVVQPGLPTPSEGDAAAGAAEGQAVADAAATQAGAQPVPQPDGADAAAGTAPQPKPAVPPAQEAPAQGAVPKPPPKPVEKKPRPVVAGSGGASGPAMVPGTVVEVDGHKVPVPALKKKRP